MIYGKYLFIFADTKNQLIHHKLKNNSFIISQNIKPMNQNLNPIEPTNIQVFAMGLSAIIAGTMLCSFMWAIIDIVTK